MKKILNFLGVFLICTTSFAFAADGTYETNNDNPPLAVRGADIDSVSRIVFDGIPQNAYRVVPLNNKLKIIFQNFEYSFLEQDLLSIGLLKNIKELSIDKKDGYTILSVDYSCACQGDFYKWYNKKLVLDVFSLDATSNPLKVKKSHSDPQKDTNQKQENSAPPQQASLDNTHKITETSKQPQNFEQHLKELVKIANQSGLVDYKESEKPISNLQTKDPVADIIAHNNTAKSKGNTISNPKIEREQKTSNKVVKTSETEKLLPTDVVFTTKNGTCLPDSAFKLPSNNPEYDNFYDKISDYRNDLIGEFDDINPENALKLAYHYISYGLGEEALQVLSNFPVPDQRGHIAKSMAELLTNRKLSDNSVFKNVDNCVGSQSLWAAYRYFKLGSEAKATKLSNFAHAADILKTFPVILQTQIGSSLALNLVRQESYASALELVNVLAMSRGQFNASVLLVRGLIDAKNGLADRALKRLVNVVDKTQGLDQQMAGLALSELKLASSIDLNQRDISILEEVIFLKGRELSGVQALALIAENESRYGNFKAAFERLSQKIYNNKQVKDPARIKAEQLFKRIAISGEGNENPKTLSVYWAYPELIPKNPVYLQAFAQRLFETGYDYGVVKVIKDIQKKFPDYSHENDVTFLKGQALFRQGLYQDAINALNLPVQDNKQYLHLKAKSLHKIGQNQQAIALLSDLKDNQSIKLKASFALAEGDWDHVKQSYESLDTLSEKPELYYRTKASAYMAGYQYPGVATEYKNAEDIVFHQPESQAKSIDNVVNETKKIIELIEGRSHKINELLQQREQKINNKKVGNG
ncbi:MAG: hypothetical protein ACJA1M_000351 [Alphaproteobacteria bacterium]|jgi:hypothetical protein